MEALFERFASGVALTVETAGALLIAMGAIEALVRAFGLGRQATLSEKRAVWLHFARWLVLALEFELAADIVRTAISPSWDDVGQLAAIAAIRTFLNYFLERDLEKIDDVDYRRAAT